MFRNLLFIGIGSFIGGISRFLLQQFMQKQFPSTIPYGTLSVNIIGCFVIGVVYELSAKHHLLSDELRLFLAAGICGGFTTFSSFAYENVAMVLDGRFYYALLYIVMSVVIGFGAVHAGILFIKMIA